MATADVLIPRGLVFAAFCATLLPLSLAFAQQPQTGGGPDDWTHHRLVFSDPGSQEDPLRRGAEDRWQKVVNDPRYALQRRKRDAAAKGSLNIRGMFLAPDAHGPENAQPCEPFAPNQQSSPRRGLAAAPSASGAHSQLRCESSSDSSRPLAPPLQADWSENMGSGATAGLGMYPAKYSFNISAANCGNAAQPDFVVYNTSQAGSSSQASLIAYDNLYSGCSGTAPATYWAYNTNGTIVTSVVLSLDGTQIAFAQTGSGGAASLAILKWQASTTESAGSPGTPSSQTTSSYRGCSAPCMVTLNFSGGANDSGSSVFYDYSSDSLYVGDDSGKLHKFTGVFDGMPEEVTTLWPVSVTTTPLTSPVLDPASANILVGDYLPVLGSFCGTTFDGDPCGYFYSISTSCVCVVGMSSQLDYNLGIVDAPLVDATTGAAYVFVGDDGSTACGTDLPCAGVFQFSADFVSGNGREAQVGLGYELLLAGTLDNEYFSSEATGSATGNLYVVGNTGEANNTVYRIPINSGVMSTSAVAGPEISTNFTTGDYQAAGLPLTEIYTGTNDYIFLSVLTFGAPANCTSSLTEGCVMGFDVTSGSLSSSATPTGATSAAGGTSAIIIDNASSFSGASNIYYTPLENQTCTTGGSGGCAIQISQASP